MQRFTSTRFRRAALLLMFGTAVQAGAQTPRLPGVTSPGPTASSPWTRARRVPRSG